MMTGTAGQEEPYQSRNASALVAPEIRTHGMSNFDPLVTALMTPGCSRALAMPSTCRCYSVSSSQCPDAAATQVYAQKHYYGTGAPIFLGIRRSMRAQGHGHGDNEVKRRPDELEHPLQGSSVLPVVSTEAMCGCERCDN